MVFVSKEDLIECPYRERGITNGHSNSLTVNCVELSINDPPEDCGERVVGRVGETEEPL